MVGLRRIWEARGARKDVEALIADQSLFLARPPFASLDPIVDDLRRYLAETEEFPWMEKDGGGFYEGYRHFLGMDPSKGTDLIGIGVRAGGDSPHSVGDSGVIVRTSGARAKIVAREWLLARGYEIVRETPGM